MVLLFPRWFVFMSPSELVLFPVVFVTFVGCCSGVVPLAELIGGAS